ncbi:MAG: putative metallopeptidase [Candidatus Paceibacterota bacterium]
MPDNKQVKNVPLQFDRADTVAEIAKRLIPKFHTHLVNARIAYLFKNKEIKKGGKIVIATAGKCSPKENALAKYNNGMSDVDVEGFDFLLIVSYPVWQTLTDAQKLAVIDHELSHMLVQTDDESEDGDTKYTIIEHDVQEFCSVIERHGLYMKDLENFAEAVKNLESEVPETDTEPDRED